MTKHNMPVCVCSVMTNSSQPQWPAAHQAPLSMTFSKQDTGAGGHFILQGIFPAYAGIEPESLA